MSALDFFVNFWDWYLLVGVVLAPAFGSLANDYHSYESAKPFDKVVTMLLLAVLWPMTLGTIILGK